MTAVMANVVGTVPREVYRHIIKPHVIGGIEVHPFKAERKTFDLVSMVGVESRFRLSQGLDLRVPVSSHLPAYCCRALYAGDCGGYVLN